ncbi:TonB-dependent receptor [Emticicia sp. CRIBPO]|uniref:TonB-dependent receptor n=1 Tax=Emticicia sp. CRIBPO TaxID=2683258 RepID=UPI001413589A|nr:TonB-dependent receptor [Emticicia sp. CRIBPO]NBA86486.1 TonB-dependent receptor [Emticicia sp. CRIBPO]
MKKLFTLFLITITIDLSAQSISGIVVDDKGEKGEFLSVVLLNAKDSTLAKGAITDVQGKYELKGMPAGSYFISVTGVGFTKTTSSIFEYKLDNHVVETISMKSSDTNLKGITVTATKPMIEVQADKLIVNVEGSINSTGLTALELLQKSPGVQVDQDDNVVIEGKQGVRIYIDGKPSPLSGRDLASVLKSMQSSDIEAIEIITNPSAKYDAAGNVGIINIRLKKNKKLGTNGNINLNPYAGMLMIEPYRKFEPKIDVSGSLNYRNKKWNLFGKYGAGQGIYNNFRQNDKILNGTSFNNSIKGEFHNRYQNFKGGADYSLDDKNTVGFVVNGSFGNYNSISNSKTLIGKSTEAVLDSAILSSNSSSPGTSLNLNYNLNYRFADTKEHELTIDADYGTYTGRSNLFQPNTYTFGDPAMQPIIRNYRQSTPTDITILSFKADYEQPFYKGKLGYGVKASDVKSNNVLEAYIIKGDIEEHDIDKSNTFTYSEKVFAGYINYNKTFNKKWSLQSGIRAEHTISHGNLVSYKQNELDKVDRSYLNFFPSFALTNNFSKNLSFNLNYSRRINRPSYQDLNPFEYRIDELTYYKGNAFIKPRYTDRIKLSNTFKSVLTTSLSYYYTSDDYNNISRIDGNKIYNTLENFSNSKGLSLNVSLNTSITKWWEINYNYFYQRTSIFGKFKGEGDYNVANRNFGFNGSNNFKLNKTTTFEISGYFRSKFNWIYVNKAQGQVDIGLKKNLFKDKADIKLSMNDIFNNVGFSALFVHNDIYQNITGVYEARRFGINFNYRFGSNEIKSAREHKGGAEDESSRIK